VQTIAHNTLVADETSHFNAQLKESELYHPDKLFSHIGPGPVQVMSARDEHAYHDIRMETHPVPAATAGRGKPVCCGFSSRLHRLPPTNTICRSSTAGQLMKNIVPPTKLFTDFPAQPLGRKKRFTSFYGRKRKQVWERGMVQFTFFA